MKVIDFIFYGNKQEQYKQVGNAVPPEFARRLSSAVRDFLIYLDENENRKLDFHQNWEEVSKCQL